MRDLVKLSRRYVTLAAAGVTLERGLEPVFHNAANEVDQMPFLLAALDPDDTDAQFRDKSRLVASYLDLVYVRKAVNNKVDKSDVFFAEIFPLIPEVRQAGDLGSLAKLLGRHAVDSEIDFTAVRRYGLRPDNRAQVRYLLARLTAFVETECGKPNEIDRYLMDAESYEVEHVWANKFDRYQAEVKTEDRFRFQRNLLGALLLLRKSHNASYQAAPYEEKVEWYRGQNHLAASLHKVTHDRNRPFTEGVVKKYELQKLFRPFSRFDVSAIDTLQLLYERLCEIIWDPKRLEFLPPITAAPPDCVAARAIAKRTRAHFGGISLTRLNKSSPAWAPR